MNNKKLSLTAQIKKAIGNRVLFCSGIFILIIFSLTLYDLSISMTQLRSRINESVKPIEDFVIDQAMIDNLDTVQLKIDSFNESHTPFKIQWVRNGESEHPMIHWRFPFSWEYDYCIGKITGYHLGYFKVTGFFLSDKTLFYDLLLRVLVLFILMGSVLVILYPLAKKIPEKLFIKPINRFIDLVSCNTKQNKSVCDVLPVELEILECKILGLLRTATEHERNKADIELGKLAAQLAHDIRSPLVAMEMSVHQLTKKTSGKEIDLLMQGIQNVKDIANNMLERFRHPMSEENISFTHEDGNTIKSILAASLVEDIVSQKRHEWYQDPCVLTLNIHAKSSWITVAPNAVRRMLSNILNNAYDAISDKKTGIINVTLEQVNHYIYIAVSDNGSGIPDEKIADVLDGASLKHSGKGLGLSAAKQYMESIQGDLQISSVMGKGTEVTLLFPLSEEIHSQHMRDVAS